MTLNRDDIANRLAAVGYIADHDVATAIWLMDFFNRPRCLGAEPGSGRPKFPRPSPAGPGPN